MGKSARTTSASVSAMIAAGMLGIGIVGGLSACTSYTNVPGPDNNAARQNPNARQASAATETGLQWAVRRHPVDGPYLINLPVGTSLETARRIATTLGPDAVIPVGGETGMPTYHVTRVWIRVSDAKVDVVYPMNTYDGRQIDRGVTVWMHAGVRPWVVSRGQYWAPGTVQTPPVWIPLPQDELDAIARAERLGGRVGEPIETESYESSAPERIEAAPIENSPAQTEVIPAEPEPVQSEPARTEPVQARPAPTNSGTVWREVPVNGG